MNIITMFNDSGWQSAWLTGERAAMVEHQLRERGISDERVLEAMRAVPRHEFVNPEDWTEAYADHPIVIGEQQTTSQPYIIAAMLQAARIEPTDRVLEIGSYEGLSTTYIIEQCSAFGPLHIHCVDTWEGAVDLPPEAMNGVEARFDRNVMMAIDRVRT